MNPQIVLERIRKYLNELGMAARGADKTDFQFPSDRTLYFRTGSAYHEVSIIPVVDEVTQPAIRILNEGQIESACLQIAGYVDRHEAKEPV